MPQITDVQAYLKETALANGAVTVGFTKIRRTEPVILLAFPYSDKWFFRYPFTLSKDLINTYMASKHAQNLIADVLVKEGYSANYKTILSLFGDFRPLAHAAGLGDWGRNGLIVNKEHGSALLFAAIFTNAPLIADTPTPDQVKHCSDCGQCADACPANAFANGSFHLYRCLPYSIRGCAECLKACGPKQLPH